MSDSILDLNPAPEGDIVNAEFAVVEIDGSRYDGETGEFLGFVDRPAFAVVDQDSAEWVLSRMLQAEAAIAAIDHSSQVHLARAILANADAMRREQAKRLDSLHRRFDGELGEFARRELAGKKSRTLKTLLGSISLKVVKGGLKVNDPATALHIAKTDYPDAVKTTETFLPSMLTTEQKEFLIEGLRGTLWGDDDLARAAFKVDPDRETVTIKTGVEA